MTQKDTDEIIAIVGTVASGKGTVAKRIAKALGYTFLDSGALYRAAALAAMRAPIDLNDDKAVIAVVKKLDIKLTKDNKVFLNGEDVSKVIRDPKVGMNGSVVIGRIKETREYLTNLQKKMGKAGRVVAEGRDTATVVFPNAFVKIYLDADPKVRAQRRVLEYAQKGLQRDLETELDDLRKRDQSDMNRSIGPLVRAPGDIYIDTTNMTIEEVVETILQIVRKQKKNQ